MPVFRLFGLFTGICLAAGCSEDFQGTGIEQAEGAGAQSFLARLTQPEASDTDDVLSRLTGTSGDRPLRTARFAGGAVVVAGPAGYCIDPKTLKRGNARSFAMIASCQILMGGKGGPDVDPALITVTVGGRANDADLPKPADLARLSGSTLISGAQQNGMVMANLSGGGDRLLGDGDSRYWRGVFLQNGRLVALALYAPKGSGLAGKAGAQLLSDTRAAIVAGSPKRPNLARHSGASQAIAPARGEGMFGRLFNR